EVRYAPGDRRTRGRTERESSQETLRGDLHRLADELPRFAEPRPGCGPTRERRRNDGPPPALGPGSEREQAGVTEATAHPDQLLGAAAKGAEPAGSRGAAVARLQRRRQSDARGARTGPVPRSGAHARRRVSSGRDA